MNINGLPILVQDQNNVDQWVLVKDYYFWIGETLHQIPKGFITDFASIPRLFWNIISPTELGDSGPLIHDWLYRNGIGTRAAADRIFLDTMTADKIPIWKCWSCYLLVRAWGWRSWNSGSVEIIMIEGDV